MNNKRLSFVAGVSILLLLLYPLWTHHHAKKHTTDIPSPAAYFFVDSRTDTHMPQVSKPVKHQDKITVEQAIVTSDSLKQFQFLSHKFRKYVTLDGHFRAVKDFLLAEYPAADAVLLFEGYKKWLQCSIALKEDFSDIHPGKTPETMIAYLEQIYAFQKKYLGAGLAEKLYQKAFNQKIFQVKRSAIVNDSSLFASEKHLRLAELENTLMDGTNVWDRHEPYDIYKENLKLFQRDLAEADPVVKKELMQQIREKSLPPETATRLAAVEKKRQQLTAVKKEYKAQKTDILADNQLSDDAKKEKMKALRTNVFGKEGAKRQERIETLEAGYKKIVLQQ